MENKENKKLEAIFAFCDKALVKAKDNKGLVATIGFNCLESLDAAKISDYLESKNNDHYFIMELANQNSYEAHITYQHHK